MLVWNVASAIVGGQLSFQGLLKDQHPHLLFIIRVVRLHVLHATIHSPDTIPFHLMEFNVKSLQRSMIRCVHNADVWWVTQPLLEYNVLSVWKNCNTTIHNLLACYHWGLLSGHGLGSNDSLTYYICTTSYLHVGPRTQVRPTYSVFIALATNGTWPWWFSIHICLYILLLEKHPNTSSEWYQWYPVWFPFGSWE